METVGATRIIPERGNNYRKTWYFGRYETSGTDAGSFLYMDVVVLGVVFFFLAHSVRLFSLVYLMITHSPEGTTACIITGCRLGGTVNAVHL